MAAETAKPPNSLAVKAKAHCAIPLCSARNAVLHPMPAEGPQRQAWVDFVRRCPNADILAWAPPKNERSYVCSLHFSPKWFMRSVRVHVNGADVMCRFLRSGAVPTLYPNATDAAVEQTTTNSDLGGVAERLAFSGKPPVPGRDLDVSASGHSDEGQMQCSAEQQQQQQQQRNQLQKPVVCMKMAAVQDTAQHGQQPKSLMMPPRCGLPTCGRPQGPNIMLYPLPSWGRLRQAWISFVRNSPDGNLALWTPSEHRRTFVCSLHFGQASFQFTEREMRPGVHIVERTLKPGAVPTVYPRVGGGAPLRVPPSSVIVNREQSLILSRMGHRETGVQCIRSACVASKSTWYTVETVSKSTQACSLPMKVHMGTQLGRPADYYRSMPWVQSKKRKKASLSSSDGSESNGKEKSTGASGEEMSSSGNGKNMFACGFCSRTFPSLHRLNSHVLTCVWPEPYPCCLCTRTFTDQESMRRHIACHMSEQPSQCPVCSSTFSGKSAMLHVLSHLSVKPFKCTICSSSFVIKSGLDRHIRQHTGEKPHLCSLCLSSFASLSTLTSHMRRHTGEKPYKCRLCADSFGDKASLSLHVRRLHTGEKPYKCNVCARLFVSKRYHTLHMRVHTGDRSRKGGAYSAGAGSSGSIDLCNAPENK